MNAFVDIPLNLIKPDFDSNLIETIIELDQLRKIQLAGTTPTAIFYQIKAVFHMLESLESARIEGNRTTISEYVDTKIDKKNSGKESIWELENIEKAMHYVEEISQPNVKLTNNIIREIHKIVVEKLIQEGDHNPGSYRIHNVKIQSSNHIPPDWTYVSAYMNEFLDFLNEQTEPRYDLLKIATAHHRFTWIHPFGNGNGRVVRILTYLLLIKYGFKPQAGGRILNPTAVFCNNRGQYYDMLSKADTGTDYGLEQWCLYILSGINQELKRVDQLTQYDYLKNKILLPAIHYCHHKNIVNDIEAKILNLAIQKKEFKSSDLEKVSIKLDARKRTYHIKKLIDAKMIAPVKENSRTYHINFIESSIIRGVVHTLKAEGFTSALED